MESLICTVNNEEKSISELLDSILSQSKLPSEVIIVDAMSSDNTFFVLKSYVKKFECNKIQYRLFQRAGNRSAGRNYAISQAEGKIILATDAGCILHKDWVKNLTGAFKKDIDVVSGYYLATSPDKKVQDSLFQKALAAYTSVMPDKFALLDEQTYIPSSRSIAFRKSAWAGVKGYPQELDTAEDLAFARLLKQKGYTFALARKAIVYWPQKKSLFHAFQQFFGYAYGDGKALYFRPSTPFLYGRYLFGTLLLLSGLILASWPIVVVCGVLMCAYFMWAIHKNHRYVQAWQAIFILPTLQVVSDIAVLTGMSRGMLSHPVLSGSFLQIFGKLFTVVIGFFSTAMLARHLGPHSFGEFSLIFSVSTLAFMLADLGLDTYLVRTVAEEDAKNAVHRVFSLRLYLVIALSSFLGLFLNFSDYSSTVKLGISVASMSSILLVFSNILWSVYKGTFQLKKIVAAQVINSIIMISLFAIGLLQKLPLIYFVIFHVFGFLGGFIFTLYCWDRPYRPFELISKDIKSLLIRFLPFIGIFIFATAYFKIDMIILGFFHPPETTPAIGLYALAYKPFEIAIMLGGYFTQTLLPYFVGVGKKTELTYIRFFRKLTYFIALASSAGLFVAAPVYVGVIGGSEYGSAVQALRILAPAAGITILSGYAASKLLAERKEKAILAISLIAFCINIVANWIFVPQYSYIASSWITLATQLIVLIGYSLI